MENQFDEIHRTLSDHEKRINENTEDITNLKISDATQNEGMKNLKE